MKLKLTSIGTSTGVIIPKEMLARMNVEKGDALYAIEAPDGSYRIGVRDFGGGVAEAERESIFARFRRGSAHRHGSIPGVGLGLHLARTIVRRHGGDLVCRAPDGDGAGTEFVFTLALTNDGGTTEHP